LTLGNISDRWVARSIGLAYKRLVASPPWVGVVPLSGVELSRPASEMRRWVAGVSGVFVGGCEPRSGDAVDMVRWSELKVGVQGDSDANMEPQPGRIRVER